MTRLGDARQTSKGAEGKRLEKARRSLAGLSVGDGFGEGFFSHPRNVEQLIAERAPPRAPWAFTDDTVMAMSVVDVLEERGAIDGDLLAELFAARYRLDPARGYGGTAHEILARIAAGEHWRAVSNGVFDGAGSMGNGAAMRAAPIGGYFAGDIERAVAEARSSAEVTHAHPEGQAGAIAVAVAAAVVAGGVVEPDELFATVLAYTPDGETCAGIARAAAFPRDCAPRQAALHLGNGSRVVARDTVPFCLWNVARHLNDFEAALWSTVAGLGDRDTTCAIVGGIVALHRNATIPDSWLAAREPLERMSRSLLAR